MRPWGVLGRLDPFWHGLRDATLVSVLAYAGLRPEEALALEDQHVRGRAILIEQKWVDGEIVPGQKTNRPPRFPPLLDVLRTEPPEWMGHSPATLLTHYAHLIADVGERSNLPRERAINAARETQPTYTTTSSGARLERSKKISAGIRFR